MRVRRQKLESVSTGRLRAVEIIAESLSEEQQLARFYLDLRHHGEGVLRMGAKAKMLESQPGPPDYLGVHIFDRECWVSREDFRILYGLAGNVTGEVRKFADLPPETPIVRVSIIHKGKSGGRKRLPPGTADSAV